MAQQPSNRFSDPVPTAYPASPPSKKEGGHLIPYRNPMALIGYYLAVLSLVPGLGLLTGPIAIILGFLGYATYRREPDRHGQVHAVIAIVLGLICTLIWGGLIVLFIVLASAG
jgi:uncharacterized protein YqgC (DUF456 family)